jgi:5-methylcytosine-specific restriction endonuclease McrA
MGERVSELRDRFGSYSLLTGHEGTGQCWWCGGEYPDRRPRRFCSRDCAEAYAGQFVWTIAAGRALRLHPTCADCGAGYSRIRGVRNLEVHHLAPLNGEDRNHSLKNRPDNLVVLCHDCHMKRHHPEPEPKGPPPIPLFDYAGVSV